MSSLVTNEPLRPRFCSRHPLRARGSVSGRPYQAHIGLRRGRHPCLVDGIDGGGRGPSRRTRRVAFSRVCSHKTGISPFERTPSTNPPPSRWYAVVGRGGQRHPGEYSFAQSKRGLADRVSCGQRTRPRCRRGEFELPLFLYYPAPMNVLTCCISQWLSICVSPRPRKGFLRGKSHLLR